MRAIIAGPHCAWNGVYLPREGALNEMVFNAGKTVRLALRGVDGIIDISPFICNNGIVSEAVYPRVSRDLGGLRHAVGPGSGPGCTWSRRGAISGEGIPAEAGAGGATHHDASSQNV